MEDGINVEGVQIFKVNKCGGWHIAARVISFCIQIAEILVGCGGWNFSKSVSVISRLLKR